MATIDEDLKAYLQGDSSIAREVGARIHENHVPLKTNPDGSTTFVAVPFIYFVQDGEIREDCLDDAQGTLPTGYRFALQVVAQSIRHARSIAALVVARLHLATGTFGSSTIQVAYCEEQIDNYVDRTGAADRGFHVSAFQVEVYQ